MPTLPPRDPWTVPGYVPPKVDSRDHRTTTAPATPVKIDRHGNPIQDMAVTNESPRTNGTTSAPKTYSITTKNGPNTVVTTYSSATGGIVSHVNTDPNGKVVEERYYSPDGNGTYIGDHKDEGGNIYDGDKMTSGPLGPDGMPTAPAGGQSMDATAGVNSSSFGVPGYADSAAAYNKQWTAAGGRQAPQSQGSVLAPLVQSAQTQLSPMQQASTATTDYARLGPAAQTGQVNIGAAGVASAGKLGPAAQANTTQAADSAFRNDQQNALSHFSNLMLGNDSIAGLQGKRLTDQAMSGQLSMAASARPGSTGMAQRLASQNMGKISGDMAGRTQEAQLAERNAAGQQVSQLSTNARGQDLGLNTFNAGQLNQGSQFNAGQSNQQSQVGAQLGTQASIANAGNLTSRNIAQGNLQGNIGMFNTGQQNTMANNQADFQQRSMMANQAAANAGSQFNAGQVNQAAMHQGTLNQATGRDNAAAANAYGYNQANLAQSNSQFNVSAQQNQQQVNDAAQNNYLKAIQSNQQMQQQGMMTYEQMINANRQAELNRQNALKLGQIAAQSNDPKVWERVLGVVGALGGAVIGGVFGGPAGAAAGGAAGGALGNAAGGFIGGAGQGAAGGGYDHTTEGVMVPGQYGPQ